MKDLTKRHQHIRTNTTAPWKRKTATHFAIDHGCKNRKKETVSWLQNANLTNHKPTWVITRDDAIEESENPFLSKPRQYLDCNANSKKYQMYMLVNQTSKISNFNIHKSAKSIILPTQKTSMTTKTKCKNKQIR